MSEPPQKRRKLPALSEAFSTQPLPNDSPDFHQGRTRAVPHAKGQWAAHIYLELEPTDSLQRALAKAESLAKRHTSATKTDATALHVSLSRPLHLQTSQRVELRTAVAAAARATTGFPVRFASFGVLENDERTRRFLGIEIGTGYAQLKDFVHQLDLALTKMRLPPYYDQPRFHTSLLWSTTTTANPPTSDPAHLTPPDSKHSISSPLAETNSPPPDCEPTRSAIPFSDATVAALEAELGRALRADGFYVAEVCVKIGKDVKRFPLAS